jgi:two-component system response regulator
MRARVILLVEDNPDDIDLTLRAFSGHRDAQEVVVARDGNEALEYLHGPRAGAMRVLSPLPGVVLLDLKLPKLNGLEVLRRIRAHARTKLMPVVVLTSSREDRDLADSYKLGANSYIRKPVDYEAFERVAEELRHYWLSLNEPPPVGAAV